MSSKEVSILSQFPQYGLRQGASLLPPTRLKVGWTERSKALISNKLGRLKQREIPVSENLAPWFEQKLDHQRLNS